MLLDAGAFIDAQDGAGATPLHVAVMKGQLQVSPCLKILSTGRGRGGGGGGERTGRVCYDFIPVQDKSGTTLSHMDTMDELTQWMNLNMIYCVGDGGGRGGGGEEEGCI